MNITERIGVSKSSIQSYYLIFYLTIERKIKCSEIGADRSIFSSAVDYSNTEVLISVGFIFIL